VDLNGTLVKVDTLYDSLVLLLRRRPAAALNVPLWLFKGKAHLKRQLRAEAQLSVESLPYNQMLLNYLREQKDAGLANRVAEHLGLFDRVFASDGAANLTGRNKLNRLSETFAETGFDYIGNALSDVELLQHAGQAMVANPKPALLGAIDARHIPISRCFEDRTSLPKALLRAMRVHQWAKNVLVVLPLLLAHTVTGEKLLASLLAFFCFSFSASATYMVNDLLDVEADRQHPRKRLRPFAAGNLSVLAGTNAAAVLLVLAGVMLFYLPLEFSIWLGVYVVSTLAYSFYLKRRAPLDVLLLSGLYTIRLLAGGGATHTPISAWLANFSIFFFLSLAMVKRFSELQNLRLRDAVPANGRGYRLSDIEQLRSFGTVSAYASVVVFTLYISQSDVAALYSHARRMWMIAPLLILWLSRIWLLASRGELDEDPVIFAIRDRTSLLIVLGMAGVAFLAL
jgi:4-hydroxybenzoate polyprenyltransferase